MYEQLVRDCHSCLHGHDNLFVDPLKNAQLRFIHELDTLDTMDTNALDNLHLTAAERVTVALRTAIMSGSLAAGAPIRQEELASTYQVSRMPVREALRQLETEGLVVVYAGRGAFVNRPTPNDIQEIYEIRSLLERDALLRAFPNFTQAILGQAEDVLEKMEQASDGPEFGQLDMEFHMTLYKPSGRSRLLNLISILRNQATQAYFFATPVEAFRQMAIDEHHEILQACKMKDSDSALLTLSNHLDSSAKYIAERWAQHG